MHYGFTFYELYVYYIVLQDCLSSLAFLAICFLFCKNSSKLLPKRKKWLKWLKIVGLVSLGLFLFLAILSAILDKRTSTSASCKTWLYVFLNLSSTCICGLFLAAGLRIQKKIRDYVPETRYEQAIHHINSHKSLYQLRLCIGTFLGVNIYSNLYSISLKLFAVDCAYVTKYYYLNQALWFTSRGTEHIFWIYPFMYIFWPRTKNEEEMEKIQEMLKRTEQIVDVSDTCTEDEVTSVYAEHKPHTSNR